jgi:hypothetical protein
MYIKYMYMYVMYTYYMYIIYVRFQIVIHREHILPPLERQINKCCIGK